MIRIIFTLVLVGACVGALGFYRGWFHLASDSNGGHSNVTLTVDKNKIQDDKQAASDKAHDLAQHP